MRLGSVVALITPFDKEGEVNYIELKRLIEFQIENKTDAILLLGTTAETPTLSKEEEYKIVDEAIRCVSKRVKIIVGITSNNTLEVLRKIDLFRDLAIDYYLAITPYYNKTNENGMYMHFLKIADYANKPIILYNVPHRCGVSISIDNLIKLKRHPNIIGIKEASGNIQYLTEVAGICDEQFFLFCGDDEVIIPSYALGAKGVISVVNNALPQEIKKIVCLLEEHKYDEANQLFFKYYKLIKNIFSQTSPIPIKHLLNYLKFEVGECRLPLGTLDTKSIINLITEYEYAIIG